jgi:thiol:disulfide interchange protein DsbC
MNTPTLSPSLAALCLSLCALTASAQDAALRKNLQDRLPQIKSVDEIQKTDIPGIFEVRINGTDIVYTDAKGNYILYGNLLDTRNRRNLTEERVEKLTAINFSALPLKDAITITRGNGQRKLAVFQDPNCGYCKRFERDLQKVDNITIYMFLYPILGESSKERAKAIWCARDKTNAWNEWMLRDQAPPTPAAMCDTSPLERNVDFGRKYKIQGTPTLIFANGARVPGAVDAAQVEKQLAQNKP